MSEWVVLRPVRHIITGNHRKNRKYTKNNINKLALSQENTQTSKLNPKPAFPSAPARTSYLHVVMTMYNCGTQYTTEQF